MADRVERLRDAAQARHEVTLRRAESVLQRMAKRGDPVTFNRVAETAGVSRSWLYRQPTLRQEIDRLRDASASRPGLPSAERASTDSLRQQLHTYREEITRLRTENQELREQLARHSAPPARQPSHDPHNRRRRHVYNKKDVAPQQIQSEGSREYQLCRGFR
jgi:regulator of replication initiation timing